MEQFSICFCKLVIFIAGLQCVPRGVIANRISFPGDLVERRIDNTTQEGYLIRVVDKVHHSPPALVAWKSNNYIASWVNVEDITLKNRSESADMSGYVYRCKESYTNATEYLNYVNSALKIGVMVRSRDNTGSLWKGDTCVYLGRDGLNITSVHLWCYRPKAPVIEDNLANLEVMGVTNYPGVYEYLHTNGNLLGNYQYPVVRFIDSAIDRRQRLAGFNNTATVRLQCGINLRVTVNHAKSSSNYQSLNSSLSVRSEVNLTTFWSSTKVGDHYVEFRIMDRQNYYVSSGFWITVVAPATHEVKLHGSGEDARFVYKGTTLTGNQLVTTGNKDFTGYIVFNESNSNQAMSNLSSSSNAVFHLTFHHSGLREVYFLVWNRLSIEVVKILVLIPEVLPMRSLNITNNKDLQSTNQNFSFSVSVINGSDIICLVNYGDGSHEEFNNSYTKFLNSFTNATGLDLTLQTDIGLQRNLTKSYKDSGVYLVEAKCSNRLASFSSTATVLVQKTIVGLALRTLPAFQFGSPMTVTWDMSEGTNVSVQILYNNMYCCNSSMLSDQGGSCDCLVNDTSLFDPDEVVDITVVAGNLVSNSSHKIEVQVLEKIILTNLIMLTSTSYFGSGVPGFGNYQNKFPVEYPVRFNANYRGSEATNITWLLRCIEPLTLAQTFSCEKKDGSWSPDSCGVINGNSIKFEYTFPRNTDQTYWVELTIRNVVGESSLSVSADLDESIIYQSLSQDGPVKMNESVTITIQFQQFGTDTCLVVDLADNSPLLVYGTGLFCQTKFSVSESNPNEQRQVLFTQKDSSTQSIVVQHLYQVTAVYNVRINASNYVSMASDETQIVVLDKRCEYPNVTIKGISQNKSNVLYASQHYRSVSLTLTTENVIDCEKTDLTRTNWTIHKLDDDPRIEKLQKSEYQFSDDIELSSPELFLPEKSMTYGFYEITVRVEMDGFPDVFGENTTYIQVVQTPWLVPALTTGAFNEQIFGEQAVLNASVTADPDFDGLDGISFAWLCKDIDDTMLFDSDLSKQPLIYIPQVNDTFELPAENSSGCFGTGRGRLNYTGAILQLQTEFMVEGKYFSITLLVSKYHPQFGLRTATMDVYFHVALGLPPDLKTSCSKNCLPKVNPDEKLILTATCSSRCYGQMVFTWSLFLYDNYDMPEPFNLTTLNQTSKDDLMSMVTNPIEELNLAFKPKSLEPGRKYVLQLIAKRPNGVFGELRHTLRMNTAPVDGNCSVRPSHGIALKTTFNISCSNWKDDDLPLNYEYSYEIKGDRTLFFSGKDAWSKMVATSSILPIGDTSNNNELVLHVKIKDSYEGATSLNFTLKVDPPGSGDLDLSYLKTLVSNESNQLDLLLQSGDSQKALNLAGVMASVLNHMSDNSTNEGSQAGDDKSTEDEKKHDIDRMKQTILKTLSKIEVKDMSSLLQMSGTLKMVTDKPQDVSAETQEYGVNLCNSSVNSLTSLSKGEAGFENIQLAVGNLAGSVGQLIMAATKDTTKENTTNKDSSANPAKRSISMLNKLHDATLRYLVTNEGPTTTSTEHLTIQTEKVSVKTLGQSPSEATNSGFKLPGADAFGLGDIIEDVNDTISQLDQITIKMAVFSKNPFTWDNTSKTITSNVASLELDSNQNMTHSNLTEDIVVTIPRDSTQFPEPASFYMKPGKASLTAEDKNKTYLKYHCFYRTSEWTSMNFELYPEDVGLQMKVYLKTGGKPDLENGDFNLNFELPDFSSCRLEETTSGDQLNQSSKYNETILIDPLKHCLTHPYHVFISNTDFNQTGEHCFAIQVIENVTDNNDDHISSNSRRKRSFSCDVGKRRMRRSCVIIPTPPPPPPTPSPIKILVADNLGFDGKFFLPNTTPNYNLTMFESSCLYWDEENETWAGHGCRVGPLTSRSSIQCFCSHLTSFGGELVVAPNPIDFSSVFENFGSLHDNVAVLALISTVLCLYILGVIWARRADKRDLLMVGPTILPKPMGSHRYLITLYTGNRHHAGTTAKVFFKMNGDQDDTIPVKLWDPDRPCFERGQENAFVMSCARAVGELTYVQIWHNNTGSSPSWYLSRLSVKDLQTDQQWYFVCDNWLAVESDDGKVCRVLPVANDQELTNFNQLFTARAVKGLADGHLWFSIFSRPPNSNFTRVQRLSCCLCLLCCTMITSAMFYNMGGEGTSPYAVHIGSLVIDLKQFVIGLQSSVIIIPVNVALAQIFRNLRPKEGKEQKYKRDKSEILNEHQLETKDSKPSKGKLPHWFLYVAYALCYLTSGACIFFTLLYSIQWGKTVSTEWVIAMVTAFFQSVILLQPVKVVIVAVVFALLVRKPCDSDEATSEVPLSEQPQETIKKKRKRKSRTEKIYSPPDLETLLPARMKRLKEIKMNGILKEIAAFFIFLVMLMNVAYYHRDPNTYLMTKTLFETFDEVDAYSVDLGSVSEGDSLWMWARETLVPGLYATEWYNGKKATKGYIANMEDYLVGVPRVRLVRVEKDSCSVVNVFKYTIPHCYSSYSLANEEKGTFDVTWQPLAEGTSRRRRSVSKPETEKEWLKLMMEGNHEREYLRNIRQKRALDPIMSANSGRNRRKKNRLLSSERPKSYVINDNALLPDGRIQSCLERWRHQTALELRGFPYWGSISLYSGSGYVANLGYERVTAYTVISDLHSNGWIDVQTRAAFVEFTVYNANTNLFGIVSILIEFPSSSAAFTRAQYQTARFYLHLNFGQTLSHVMVIFFMLYFFYREARLVFRQRWAYFKGFWNWVETILVFCEFSTIILFLARLYEVDRNLLQLRENPNDYVGFQYAGSADAVLSYVLGILVFFYTLRFLRLLRFNKNFLTIGKTLARLSTPILNFCLPFTFGFLAFGLFSFSVFGSELQDYSTFMITMVSQFSMILGDFDFEALVMVSPFLGPLYFFGFVGLNVFILMNIFLVIINESYAEIQDEEKETANEYEVLDYVVEKIKTALNVKQNRSKVSHKKVKRKPKVIRNYVSPREPRKKASFSSIDNPCCLKLDSCEMQLDCLLDVIERAVEDEFTHEDNFVAVPEERRNDPYFRVMLFMESIPFEVDESEEMETDENEEFEE